MKNRITAFLLCCLILLSAVSVSVTAEAEQSPVGQAQALMDGILEFQRKQASAASTQEWIDGWLCANAGKSAEWYVLGLSQSGEYDFSAYERALVEYLSKDRTVSASTRQKYALALAASGSTHRYISETLTDSIGAMGVMSVVYGLHLLNNGYVSPAYTVEETVDLRPAAIIDYFGLRKPIYASLSAYGHFGREELGVKWEDTDIAETLRKKAGI